MVKLRGIDASCGRNNSLINFGLKMPVSNNIEEVLHPHGPEESSLVQGCGNGLL